MPCYLFTYHTYGSWLPDKQQGFVVRDQGIQPTDVALADHYRVRMTESEVTFLENHQQTAIDAVLEAARHIGCRVHSVATDATHIHLLTSWSDLKSCKQKRNSFKKKLTIELKARHEERTWLSDGASRKRVKDRVHFDHLMNRYLPRHRGWKWDERRGAYL